MKTRFSVKKVNISITNLRDTVTFLNNCIEKGEYGYICVTNARTSYIANKNEYYCQIQNNSLMTVPDGTPLVWIANNKGVDGVGKVSGKDLMDEIFKISVQNNYSHYFYGCSEKTIKLLKLKLLKKYPSLQIKDAISPPFQPIEDYDIGELSSHINQLKPTFFWCGLGAPKQEILISLLQPHLEQTMTIGVGLAFEYFAGTVKRVPKQIERFGMEWLFRCFQQPIKARRFIMPFFWTLILIIKSRLK